MCSTVTTRQYLESYFEKTDKHLTRFKQDERSVTTLIQLLETSQEPWKTLKKLKSLVDDLCKKYAPKYTVGITACKSYYEKHGKLTAANHQGKFVNHQPIVWNTTLEPEWREACRNMINVLFEKNKNQLPPLIFTITALKNLISCYMLYDERGKLVENVQSAFAIIDETLNMPIPESMSSQFIQNKIDSSKLVNLMCPTDRAELLKLRQHTTTIGEWVENVMEHYQCGERVVYKWFQKFDINPKEEMKKPFEYKAEMNEDLQKKVDELQNQLAAAHADIFKLQGYKEECEELKDKCNNLIQENSALKQTNLELSQKVQENLALKEENTALKEKIKSAEIDRDNAVNKLEEYKYTYKVDTEKITKDRDKYKNLYEKKIADTPSQTTTTNEEIVPKSVHDAVLKELKELKNKMQQMQQRPADEIPAASNNMQPTPGMMMTFNTEVNNIQGLEGWMSTMSIG